MNISRKQSFIIAIILASLFIGTAAALFYIKSSKIPKIEFIRDNKGDLQAKVIIGEFQRSESKDGKKLWDLYAKEGRYYTEDSRAELVDPNLTLFKKDDEVHVVSKTASAILKGSDVSTVTARGSVVITSAKQSLKITTEEAQIFKEENRVYVPGAVTIETPLLQVKGEELKGNLETKNFTIFKNVHTIVKPKDKK